MQDNLRVCVVQMTSGMRHTDNIASLEKAVDFAAEGGCDLVALPEVAGLMSDAADLANVITVAADDPYINACVRLAKSRKLWIQNGSTPVAGDNGKCLNHASLIDSQGRRRATYNKIHLFDVFLDDRPVFKESDRYAAGDLAALVSTPWGLWGMSICYDLRFPQLYRDYARAGATVLFVPSAFTPETGAAHWEVLLRARAIENGCYVIAAAQVGNHENARKTWGHSMVVDPWGEVLLDMGGDESGVAIVDLDMNKVLKARQQIASLLHDRPYSITKS